MTTALALLLSVVVPGIGGGVLLTSLSPDPVRPGALLSRVLACGAGCWLLASGVLAHTVGISSTSSWSLTALLATLGVTLLMPRRSRTVLREAGPEAGYFTAILLAAGLCWVPVGILVARTTWAPLGSTPWYYWSLAEKIAASGSIPVSTVEWGTPLPFLDDYHLFSTGTAMLFTQEPANHLTPLRALTMLSVVVLCCGAALVANSLGSGRLASLTAVPIVVASGIGALRLTAYRPEALGLGLTLLLVALLIDWFRHRDRGALVASCLVAAVLSQVHGIALVAAAALALAASVALLPVTGRLAFLRRCMLSGLAVGGSVLLIGLLFGGSSGVEHAGGLNDASGLADPTWEFMRAIVGAPPSQPPGNVEIASTAMSGIYRGTGLWVALILLVATALLGLAAFRDQQARQVLVFTAVSLFALGAIAAVFAFGWSGYVPRRTGAQRLVQQSSLLVGPYVACALATLPLPASRNTWRTPAVAMTLTALCVGGVLSSLHLRSLVERQRPSEQVVEQLRRLEVPRDAVVLTNAYTEGYLEQVMGARGLLEGRAPYTYARVLLRANQLLREAQAFFADPQGHEPFLDRNHVEYVIVARPGSYALGTHNLVFRRGGISMLDGSPHLRLLAATPEIRVYRVTPSSAVDWP